MALYSMKKNCQHLIIREFCELRSNILWLSLLSFIAYLFIAIKAQRSVFFYNAVDNGIHIIYGLIALVIATHSFWELKTIIKQREYLLLPASILQKVISKVIFYIVAWFFLSIVLWVLANIVAGMINLLSNPSSISVIKSVLFEGGYEIFSFFLEVCALQMATIFASCYWRKNVILKVIIAIICLYFPLFWFLDVYLSRLLSERSFEVYCYIFNMIIFLLFFTLTCVRLRETEVK